MSLPYDILGVVGTLAGFALAIYIYWISKKEKGPVYISQNLQIIGTEHSILGEEIKIFYNGESVERVSSSKITVKNIGKSPIRKDDIASSDPLKISFPEGTQIFKQKVLSVTREPIGFTIPPDPVGNTVDFSFDFLDYNDAALVEIIHNGDLSRKPEIKGTIIGAPGGFVGVEQQQTVSKLDFAAPLVKAFFLIGALLLVQYNFHKMELIVVPFSPTVTKTNAGRALLLKANDNVTAARELEKMSGMDISFFERFDVACKLILVMIVVYELWSLISLLQKRKHNNLMLE